MTEPMIRGWCPGALRPMRGGDGLLVRVRPHAGRLSPRQAAGIAALSARHGNGLIDLTGRANLQLRGVTEPALPALLDGLAELGLLDDDPEAEARRNIVVAPFWQEGDGTLDLARALADALTSADAPALAPKFGFALDAGESAVLRSTSADIRIERGTTGLIVRADRLAVGAQVAAREVVACTMALAGWLVGRSRVGIQPLPSGFEPWDAWPRAAAPARVGPVAQGWLAGVEFGQIRASTFAELAARGPLRITPWRMLLIEGLAVAPALTGLINRADDPLLRVVACSGAPSCLQGIAPTRPLARRLAAHLPAGELLHVSGCAKGCAHAAEALTLVATPDGFDLIRHGRASSTPDVRALSPEAALLHLPQTADAPPI